MTCSICGCEILPEHGAVCPMFGNPSDSAHAECALEKEKAMVKAAMQKKLTD